MTGEYSIHYREVPGGRGGLAGSLTPHEKVRIRKKFKK
jgi:hypothetical protein